MLLFTGGTMALLGAGIAWSIGYSIPTMVLAMAPAGLAEMVLTGKLLGLDATVITGFQLTRILVVLVWCRTALILFERLADWAFGKVPPSASTGTKLHTRGVDDKAAGAVLGSRDVATARDG